MAAVATSGDALLLHKCKTTGDYITKISIFTWLILRDGPIPYPEIFYLSIPGWLNMLVYIYIAYVYVALLFHANASIFVFSPFQIAHSTISPETAEFSVAGRRHWTPEMQCFLSWRSNRHASKLELCKQEQCLSNCYSVKLTLTMKPWW